MKKNYDRSGGSQCSYHGLYGFRCRFHSGLGCLEGILPYPCRFLYPAYSIGSLQSCFLRRLFRCPSFHLLLHPGCQGVGAGYTELLFWLNADLRRRRGCLNSTPLYILRYPAGLLRSPAGTLWFLFLPGAVPYSPEARSGVPGISALH